MTKFEEFSVYGLQGKRLQAFEEPSVNRKRIFRETSKLCRMAGRFSFKAELTAAAHEENQEASKMRTNTQEDSGIREIEKKIAQKEAYERQLRSRESEKKRKARTRRLIRIGAEVESVYGHPIEEEDLPKLRKFLTEQEARGRFLSKALANVPMDNSEGSGRDPLVRPLRN